MSEHNKFYRNYYHNQYCQNQKYKAIGDIISNIVVPEIRTILSFVPDCYFLESKKFDSSVIPLIVDEASPERSSVIITSDVFDTLYLMEKNFVTLYIKRRYANLTIISDVEAAVQSIITGVDAFQLTTFNEDMYFKLLLSVKGSKIRNIQSAKGFGYGKFIKLVNDAIGSGSILRDFKSIDSIIDIFPEKYREDIRTAYKCTDIRFQFSLLTDADKKMILDQIIDLSDIQSVENLNNVRFQKYQINIPGLLQ
jgi:DNA-binding ferritin-like protein (Dps family)